MCVCVCVCLSLFLSFPLSLIVLVPGVLRVVAVVALVVIISLVTTQIFTKIDVTGEHIPNPLQCLLGTAVQQTQPKITHQTTTAAKTVRQPR